MTRLSRRQFLALSAVVSASAMVAAANPLPGRGRRRGCASIGREPLCRLRR